MKILRIRGRGQRRRGAALVEMAVCLPVLVTVVLGIIEFGRAMMVSELINDAAREGARKAIIAGSTNSNVTDTVSTFVQATSVNSQYVTTNITVTPAAGNPDPGNQVGSAKTGDLCKISVQVPFDRVSYVTGTWLKGKTLTATCTMRHE